MATSDTREIVIEATPEQIMDVIADFEVLPKWSTAHQSSTVLTTGRTGVRTRSR